MGPKDLEFGLLGERLGHSFSPAIHRQLAGYDYRLVELPPEEVEPFLRAGRFRGLNVTIPYKKTVMILLISCSSPEYEITIATLSLLESIACLF